MTVRLAHLSFFLPALVFAVLPNPSSADTTYVMDPLVVTSTRVETDRRNLPGSVTVISRAELLSTGATGVLDGIAASTPGVFVTQRGPAGFGLGSGAAGQLTIRGIGGAPNNQVLVLVDGRPDFTGLFGHPLPDAYALSEVNRVEVVRGPASAVYGTNAMGGVINIITQRRHAVGSSVSFRAEGGPWNTYDGDLTALGKLPIGIDYRLTAGYTTTDGHRPKADFERRHLGGSLGYNTGAWDIRAQASTTPFETHDPGPISPAITNDRWVDVVRSSASVAGSYNKGALSGEIMVHRNWGTHKFFDGWHSNDYTNGVVAQGSYSFTNGLVTTVGTDAKRYGGDALNDTTRFNYGKHHVTEIAPFATIQAPIGSLANLTASARAQHHDRYGWIFAPEAGVALHLMPRLTVRANASQGFRSPDLRALFLFPVSRDTLKPEKTYNTEAGVSWRATDWLTSDVTVFRTKASAIIENAPAPPFPPPFVNRGEFTTKGVEFESRWWLRRLHGRLFASWQDLGTQTAGSAEAMIGTALTVPVQKGRVALDFQWVHGLYGAHRHLQKLPDYSVANATLVYPVWRGVEAQIALRNLFDTKYETIAGYPMPGLHALLGIRAQIGTPE
jgi:iron complex outermembrane receptor protein